MRLACDISRRHSISTIPFNIRNSRNEKMNLSIWPEGWMRRLRTQHLQEYLTTQFTIRNLDAHIIYVIIHIRLQSIHQKYFVHILYFRIYNKVQWNVQEFDNFHIRGTRTPVTYIVRRENRSFVLLCARICDHALPRNTTFDKGNNFNKFHVRN